MPSMKEFLSDYLCMSTCLPVSACRCISVFVFFFCIFVGAGLSSNTPQYFGSRNSDDDVDLDAGYVGMPGAEK